MGQPGSTQLKSNGRGTSSRKAVRRRFALIAVPLLLLAVIALYLLLNLSQISLQKTFELRETRNVTYEARQLQEHLGMGIADVRVLSHDNDLREFVAERSERSRARLERELIAFAREKGVYAQVRVLDTTGMEIVRVDLKGEQAVAIPWAVLQDKSDRYYFQEAMRLKGNQVYISPLDLNVEHGVIEDPPNPMIRLSTPLLDAQGAYQGVVVLNIRMGPVLERIRSIMKSGMEEVWLLNHNGDWLIAPDRSMEWGFMYTERQGANLKRSNLELWKRLQASPFGQFMSGGDLFTFTQVNPFGSYEAGIAYQQPQHTLARLLASDTPWIAVIRLPHEVLQQQRWQGGSSWLNGFLLLLIVGVSVAVGRLTWRFAEELVRRHEAEQAYREERSLLTGIADNAAACVFIKDMEGRYMLVNGRWAELAGATPEAMVGHDDAEVFPARDREWLHRIDGEVLGYKTPQTFEEPITTPEGARVFLGIKFPITDDQGHLRGLGAILTDITQRKQAEERLRLTQFTVDQAPNAIYWVRPDGTIFYANHQACLQLDIPWSELEGKPMARFDLEEAHHGKEPGRAKGRYESQHCDRSGRVFPVEIAASTLEYEGVTLRILIARDISEQKQALQAIQESEERFRQLAENINEVFWLGSPDWGKVHYISPAFEQVWGIPGEHLIAHPFLWLESILPEDQPLVRRILEDPALQEHEEIKFPEYRVIRPDGSQRWIQATAYPIRNEVGEVFRIAGIAEDVTERVETEYEMHLAELVFANTAEGVLVTDERSRILRVNRAFTEITGYTEAEAMGTTPRLIRSERHDDAFYDALWTSIGELGNWQGEIWNRRKNGEVFPVWQNITAVKDREGNIERYIGIFSDITEQKVSEERLHHLAHYDVLTDLPNRLLLTERCGHAIERARREKERLAILFIDLDNFKHVNDSLGHPVGDELLQEVARRLSGEVRSDDTVARLGGDEFVVVAEGIGRGEEVAILARKILEGFASPCRIRGHDLLVTSSIGISLFPQDGEDATTLIRNADAAMYRAKGEGKNTFHFYTEALTNAALERVVLESKLRQALERDELIIHLQPQYNLADGAMIGAEVLVRWQHPEEGLISPAKFIPVAEESGLIIPLGEWVLRRACTVAKGWFDRGLDPGIISVNLSGLQVQRGGIAETVSTVLEQTGWPAEKLELELTETFIMQQAEETIGVLDALRALGVKLAIDDFGTGYSSLSYLKRFPIQRLKIDQSFVRDLHKDSHDEAIAKAIIVLGHSLNLKVIAEGIETEEQRDFLETFACDEGQGYLLNRPMSEEAFEALLIETHPPGRSKRRSNKLYH